MNLHAAFQSSPNLILDKSVQQFLSEHQDVADFLKTAYEEIRKAFPNQLIPLRMVQDLEDPYLKMLVLSVVTRSDEAAEAYEKFTELEDQWFLKAADKVSDRVCFKLEFE